VRDLPQDALPEVALVGRSNVGKSSLINALTRRQVARTSAAPGKTRLANVYRVQRGSGPLLYLVDLPGYGYARGGKASAREFDELTREYFGREAHVSALLLIDARHPGLATDLAAWDWLKHAVAAAAVVATKIDKLSRGERIRAMRELESVVEDAVLPASAVTGEGLDELWKLIDRLANNSNPQPPRPLQDRRTSPPARATGPRRPAPSKVEEPAPSKVEGPIRRRSRPRR
jgi:GTP-binding protein